VGEGVKVNGVARFEAVISDTSVKKKKKHKGRDGGAKEDGNKREGGTPK